MSLREFATSDRYARARAALASAAILYYFFSLARPAFKMLFSDDDPMNMYHHWSTGALGSFKECLTFWSTYIRPMGAVFYLPLFHYSGFHPMPYRAAGIALIAFNLWLFYAVARRLTRDRGAAAVAVLLGCFHGCEVGLFASNGTMYDVLCFTFYFGALLVYVRARDDGRSLRWYEWLLFALMLVASLDAKEMAITLPVVVALYELLYRRPMSWMGTLLSGAIVGTCGIGKVLGRNSLITIDAYRPHLTFGQWLETTSGYLGLLFYSHHVSAIVTVLFWPVLVGIALAFRSRAMVFSAAFAFLGLLPVNFVPLRAGYVLYVPMFGFALYAAALIMEARNRLMAREPVRTYAMAATFVAVVIILHPLHRRHSRPDFAALLQAQVPTWQVIQEFNRAAPHVETGSSVLIIGGPWSETWDMYFIAHLYYRDDPSLHVLLATDDKAEPRGDQVPHVAHTMRFEGTRLLQVN